MHLHVPHHFDKNGNRARLFLTLRKLVTGLTLRTSFEVFKNGRRKKYNRLFLSLIQRHNGPVDNLWQRHNVY